MKIINNLSVISLAAYELKMSSGFVQLKPMKDIKSLSAIYMVGMPMRKSSSWNNMQKAMPKVLDNSDKKIYWDLCTQESNFLSSEVEKSSNTSMIKKYVKKLTQEARFQVGSHLAEIQISLSAKKK